MYLAYRAGEWALNRFVYENKAFAIKEIDVQTDGVIAVDQLHRWAGVRAGENLLALDLARVKRDLEMIPLVQFVSVERILPHTLRICITEREPVAQATVPGRVRAAGWRWSYIIWTRRVMSCCRWTCASAPRRPTRPSDTRELTSYSFIIPCQASCPRL